MSQIRNTGRRMQVCIGNGTIWPLNKISSINWGLVSYMMIFKLFLYSFTVSGLCGFFPNLYTLKRGICIVQVGTRTVLMLFIKLIIGIGLFSFESFFGDFSFGLFSQKDIWLFSCSSLVTALGREWAPYPPPFSPNFRFTVQFIHYF